MKTIIVVLFGLFVLSACSQPTLTPEQQKEKEITEIGYELANAVEERGQLLSAKKWHKLTVYETSTGGFLYYLGTNSINGLNFYWNGDLSHQKIQALDTYSAKQMWGVKLYEGADKEMILNEWTNSEESKNLNKIGLEPLLK